MLNNSVIPGLDPGTHERGLRSGPVSATSHRLGPCTPRQPDEATPERYPVPRRRCRHRGAGPPPRRGVAGGRPGPARGRPRRRQDRPRPRHHPGAAQGRGAGSPLPELRPGAALRGRRHPHRPCRSLPAAATSTRSTNSACSSAPMPSFSRSGRSAPRASRGRQGSSSGSRYRIQGKDAPQRSRLPTSGPGSAGHRAANRQNRLMRRDSLFSIPPDAPFLATLADRVLDGTLLGNWPRTGPFWLSDVTIILPTRRARLKLAEIFAERLGGVTLLPDIRTLGGEQAEEEPFLPPFTAPVALTPVPPLKRMLTLARLVDAWARTPAGREVLATPPNAAEIFGLAQSLGTVLDDLVIEGGSLKPLDDAIGQARPRRQLAPDQGLPRYRGRGLAADRRRRGAGRRGGAAQRPAAAAGRGGAAALGRAPGHRRRLHRLDPGHGGPARGDRQAAARRARPARARHLAQRRGVQAPARPEATAAGPPAIRARAAAAAPRRLAGQGAGIDRWRFGAHGAGQQRPGAGRSRPPTGRPSASAGPKRCRRRSPMSRSSRRAPSTRRPAPSPWPPARRSKSGRRVGIVSPDQTLSRRIAEELRRFDIDVDDAAGTPLFQSPAGRLARLVLAAAGSDFAAVDLMALLQNRALEPRARAGRGGARGAADRPRPVARPASGARHRQPPLPARRQYRQVPSATRRGASPRPTASWWARCWTGWRRRYSRSANC